MRFLLLLSLHLGHIGSVRIFITVRCLFRATWPVSRPVRMRKCFLLEPMQSMRVIYQDHAGTSLPVDNLMWTSRDYSVLYKPKLELCVGHVAPDKLLKN